MDHDKEIQSIRHEEMLHANSQLANELAGVRALMATLPKDVAEAMPKIDIPKQEFPKEFRVANPDEVGAAVDLDEAIATAKEANALLTKLIAATNGKVKITNPEELRTKVDFKETNALLADLAKQVKILAKKETKIITKASDVNIEWPTRAKEAVPVVLVDRTKSSYYDAKPGAAPAVPSGMVQLNTIVPYKYDNIALSDYDANNNPGTVVYSYSGKTVATLTITYEGSNITNIARS